MPALILSAQSSAQFVSLASKLAPQSLAAAGLYVKHPPHVYPPQDSRPSCSRLPPAPEDSVAAPRGLSRASIDRVEKIVKNTNARFIVPHDAKDVATLPKFPAYLE